VIFIVFEIMHRTLYHVRCLQNICHKTPNVYAYGFKKLLPFNTGTIEMGIHARSNNSIALEYTSGYLQ
jgi:hypothetical protein